MLIKTALIILIIQQIYALQCPKLLSELADTESHFAYCATKHSVPITMCTDCAIAFKSMTDKYNELWEQCKSMYFDKDRINLVTSTEDALKGLWTKAYCDDCNDVNKTNAFRNKTNAFNDCLIDNKIYPCKACMDKYIDLNTFYIGLDEHNNGKVCFDLQDSMNRTRNNWSGELKCCRREFKTTLFNVALGIVTCLPFLFYGITYLVTKNQQRNHQVLNDEDPMLSLPAPSSSQTTSHEGTQQPVSTFSPVNRSIKPSKGFKKLEENSDESSDEENLASKIKLQ